MSIYIYVSVSQTLRFVWHYFYGRNTLSLFFHPHCDAYKCSHLGKGKMSIKRNQFLAKAFLLRRSAALKCLLYVFCKTVSVFSRQRQLRNAFKIQMKMRIYA